MDGESEWGAAIACVVCASRSFIKRFTKQVYRGGGERVDGRWERVRCDKWVRGVCLAKCPKAIQRDKRTWRILERNHAWDRARMTQKPAETV